MSVAWSIGKAKRGNIKRNTDFPGPAAYSCDSKIFNKKPPIYSLGKSKRLALSKTFQQTPGPGSYEIHNIQANNAPKISTKDSASQSTSIPSETVPGPGQYNPQLIKMHAGRFSFYAKPPIYKKHVSPGPGKYNVRNVKIESVPSATIGKASRNPILSNSFSEKCPGPGSYVIGETIGKNSPKYQFGKSQKQLNVTLSLFPGPGSYDHQALLGTGEKHRHTMTPMRKDRSPQVGIDSPGPATYQPKLSLTSPKHLIGTAGREKRTFSQSTPGPGSYTPAYTNFKNQPNFKVGKEKRYGLTSVPISPGPAKYKADSLFGKEGPKISMSGRLKRVEGNDNPSPAHYRPSKEFVIKKSPSHAMGTALRDSLHSRSKSLKYQKNSLNASVHHITPGPGHYNSRNIYVSKKFSFTHGARIKNEKTTEGPGPGSYSIPVKFANVPKYSLPNRRDDYKFI